MGFAVAQLRCLRQAAAAVRRHPRVSAAESDGAASGNGPGLHCWQQDAGALRHAVPDGRLVDQPGRAPGSSAASKAGRLRAGLWQTSTCIGCNPNDHQSSGIRHAAAGGALLAERQSAFSRAGGVWMDGSVPASAQGRLYSWPRCHQKRAVALPCACVPWDCAH